MHWRVKRRTVVLVLTVLSLALLPTVAGAVAGYDGPIFGLETAADGTVAVADASTGLLGLDHSLIAALPGVAGVADAGGGDWWAVTGHGDAKLYRVSGGVASVFADLGAYEAKYNPHPTEVDSNPFEVVDLGGGQAAVADAGGNDLLLVNKHGKVKNIAVLPDEPVSTDNLKTLIGCPDAPPDLADLCGLPDMIPAEPVATSVAVGPDGAFYVGELKGFPAPVGESRVWRIEPNARNARCGSSPLCAVAFDGFTSVIDLRFGPDGYLYVVELDELSWLPVEFLGGAAAGGTINACDVSTGSCHEVASGLPILTAVTFDSGGGLWAAINALVPGAAEVVPVP
jgi:hypothetical protein